MGECCLLSVPSQVLGDARASQVAVEEPPSRRGRRGGSYVMDGLVDAAANCGLENPMAIVEVDLHDKEAMYMGRIGYKSALHFERYGFSQLCAFLLCSVFSKMPYMFKFSYVGSLLVLLMPCC